MTLALYPNRLGPAADATASANAGGPVEIVLTRCARRCHCHTSWHGEGIGCLGRADGAPETCPTFEPAPFDPGPTVIVHPRPVAREPAAAADRRPRRRRLKAEA